ncbi:MAG: tyrosine-type recombinase/integrase, partial [Campylobacterota bacterium]|nr:tyrosine-type recombinase/integrase [Campylobacterota bacterium]
VVGAGLEKFSFRIIQRHLKTILDELFNKGLAIRDAKNRVVVHTLRHTFASHLAINEVPIFTIQNLMNHSDIKMTMRYAKLAPNSGKVAVQGLYK